MSPVKCKLISSIGTICAYPPPQAPPFMPKQGPKDGSRSASTVFFSDTVERIGKPYRNGRLPFPRARRRYGSDEDETSTRSFVQSAFLQSAKRFCTELCFVSSERFDPVRINPDALCDVRDRKHSIFLCYFDIRQHSVIIRANAGLCKSFGLFTTDL